TQAVELAIHRRQVRCRGRAVLPGIVVTFVSASYSGPEGRAAGIPGTAAAPGRPSPAGTIPHSFVTEPHTGGPLLNLAGGGDRSGTGPSPSRWTACPEHELDRVADRAPGGWTTSPLHPERCSARNLLRVGLRRPAGGRGLSDPYNSLASPRDGEERRRL